MFAVPVSLEPPVSRFLSRTLTVLAVALASLLVVSVHSASAQASRTWISGVGDDANPCSRTAPCKTFAGAISKTAAGGEINCLDPGGFGAVTITKSISLVCTGVIGGVLAAGTNGIVVNVADSDTVLIDGLDIEGFGTGIDGIRMVGGGRLTVRNTNVRNFTGQGVNMVGAVGARVFVDHSELIHNAGGVNIEGNGAGIANYGIVKNSVLENNTSQGFRVVGPGFILLDTTMATGSPAAGVSVSGGTIGTDGNNVLRPAPAGMISLQLN